MRINVAVAGAPSAGGKGGDGGGGGQKTPSELSIRYLVCDTEQKLPYLVRFLKVQPFDPTISVSSCHMSRCQRPSSGLMLKLHMTLLQWSSILYAAPASRRLSNLQHALKALLWSAASEMCCCVLQQQAAL